MEIIGSRIKAKGPSPHGEGGLKLANGVTMDGKEKSLPSRGGWIEITDFGNAIGNGKGPSPHGEGGLKFGLFGVRNPDERVPPLTGRVD